MPLPTGVQPGPAPLEGFQQFVYDASAFFSLSAESDEMAIGEFDEQLAALFGSGGDAVLSDMPRGDSGTHLDAKQPVQVQQQGEAPGPSSSSLGAPSSNQHALPAQVAEYLNLSEMSRKHNQAVAAHHQQLAQKQHGTHPASSPPQTLSSDSSGRHSSGSNGINIEATAPPPPFTATTTTTTAVSAGRGKPTAVATAAPKASTKGPVASNAGALAAAGKDTHTKRVRADTNRDKLQELEAIVAEKAEQLQQLALENSTLKLKHKILDSVVAHQNDQLGFLKAYVAARNADRNAAAGRASQPAPPSLMLNLGTTNIAHVPGLVPNGSSNDGSMSSGQPGKTLSGNGSGSFNAVSGSTNSSAHHLTHLIPGGLMPIPTFAANGQLANTADVHATAPVTIYSDLGALVRRTIGGRSMTAEERKRLEGMGKLELIHEWKCYLADVSAHLLTLESNPHDEPAAAALIEMAGSAVYLMKHLTLFNFDTVQAAAYVHLETLEQGEAAPGHWQNVVATLNLSPSQLQELTAVHSVYRRIMDAVLLERRSINQALAKGAAEMAAAGGHTHMHISPECAVMARLTRSLLKERCAHLLVTGYMYGTVLNVLQYATLGVYSYPWLPCPVSVVEIVAQQYCAGGDPICIMLQPTTPHGLQMRAPATSD